MSCVTPYSLGKIVHCILRYIIIIYQWLMKSYCNYATSLGVGETKQRSLLSFVGTG